MANASEGLTIELRVEPFVCYAPTKRLERCCATDEVCSYDNSEARFCRGKYPCASGCVCTCTMADEGMPEERDVNSVLEDPSLPFGHVDKSKSARECLGECDVAARGRGKTRGRDIVSPPTDVNPTTGLTGLAAGEKTRCIPE